MGAGKLVRAHAQALESTARRSSSSKKKNGSKSDGMLTSSRTSQTRSNYRFHCQSPLRAIISNSTNCSFGAEGLPTTQASDENKNTRDRYSTTKTTPGRNARLPAPGAPTPPLSPRPAGGQPRTAAPQDGPATPEPLPERLPPAAAAP